MAPEVLPRSSTLSERIIHDRVFRKMEQSCKYWYLSDNKKFAVIKATSEILSGTSGCQANITELF